MKKLTSLAVAALALYAADANAQSVRNDDGRPSIARTWDERNYDETEWYLSVPLVPYTSFNDVGLFEDTYNLVSGIFNIDFPEGDLFNESNLFQGFEMQLNGLPRVYGNVQLSEMINFGILSEWFEAHAYGGGYGRADFRFNGIDDYTLNINPLTEEASADFGREQNVIIGSALGDIVAGGNFVVPVHISDFILKPWLGFGYRHREAVSGYVRMDAVVSSEDNIHHTEDGQYRSYGDGWFMNTGIMADFSRWEMYTRPVAAISIDNAYSEMYYAENPAGLSFNDPIKVNVGLEISPMGWFNVRADFLNVNNSPEYRVEVARRLDWAEFSLYGRLNERTLLGDYRHSLNLMLGFGNDIAQVRLYGSYDNNNNFGVGLQFGLGWNPNEFM